MSAPGPRAPGISRDLGADDRISIYLDRVRRWSSAINLTGSARSKEDIRRVLVDPVLGFHAPRREGTLIDVGSGNGSPGLILAALMPERPVILLEPRARRWAFLREAARVMELPSVRVERARHDAWSGPKGSTVTLRALALAPSALRPMVAPGGDLLYFGGLPPAGSETERNAGGFEVHRLRFT